MPHRVWTNRDRELVTAFADAGRSLSEAALLIGVTRGALSGFANRNDIWFHGSQPQWTSQRHVRHSAAMSAFWQQRRKRKRSTTCV